MIQVSATFVMPRQLKVDRPHGGISGRGIVPSVTLAFIGILLVSMAAAETAASRAVLEQKVKLLESYLASTTVARIEAAGDNEANAELQRARSIFAAARTALVDGDLERAAAGLDEALRTASAATAGARSRPRRTAAQSKTEYEHLRGQILNYATALDRNPRPGEDKAGAERDRARLGQILDTASSHADAGRYDLARDALAEAYRLAVLAITAQRKGETTVFRLAFETPADEYSYERKRNDSYEMLVEITVGEKKSPPSDLTATVDRLVGESRQLRERATAAASAGDYPAAILTM